MAARNASYVTAGALGVGRNNGAIAPPENDYTPSPDATFDVAAGLGTGIEWLYFGSMGAALVGNSSVEPQDVAGAALLTLGQLGAVFQVAGSSLYTKNTLDLTPLPLGAESSGWLIWGVEVTETWPLFMVPSEGDGEVYRAGFSAIGKRLDEQVVVLTPSGNDFTGPVHALFGEQSESGGARLWAVGGADAPWLRSAEVSLDSNATTVEWVERPLPADLSGPLRSVWASQTFVAIAGPGGVYEARVVDLLK